MNPLSHTCPRIGSNLHSHHGCYPSAFALTHPLRSPRTQVGPSKGNMGCDVSTWVGWVCQPAHTRARHAASTVSVTLRCVLLLLDALPQSPRGNWEHGGLDAVERWVDRLLGQVRRVRNPLDHRQNIASVSIELHQNKVNGWRSRDCEAGGHVTMRLEVT